ncbi:putative conjugative transfer TraG domain protein [Orientia tsutsugamushi str. UT76]|nr:putative conjugative transfer TraG domain protein [Orientia tsutsugamushi str. UT76]
MLQAGYQNQFVHSQSMLNSLTQKESNLISTGNSMAMEIGQRLTHDEIRSIGLTESEYQALQEVGSSSMLLLSIQVVATVKSSSTSTSAGGGGVGI